MCWPVVIWRAKQKPKKFKKSSGKSLSMPAQFWETGQFLFIELHCMKGKKRWKVLIHIVHRYSWRRTWKWASKQVSRDPCYYTLRVMEWFNRGGYQRMLTSRNNPKSRLILHTVQLCLSDRRKLKLQRTKQRVSYYLMQSQAVLFVALLSMRASTKTSRIYLMALSLATE